MVPSDDSPVRPRIALHNLHPGFCVCSTVLQLRNVHFLAMGIPLFWCQDVYTALLQEAHSEDELILDII